MLSRILIPELLLLICCLGCTCSGHEVPIGFPLPLLPLSVISCASLLRLLRGCLVYFVSVGHLPMPGSLCGCSCLDGLGLPISLPIPAILQLPVLAFL